MFRKPLGKYTGDSYQKMNYGKEGVQPIPILAPPNNGLPMINQKPMYGETPPIIMQPPVKMEQSQIEFRAKGGPVKKKKKYIVGEEGPEVFVPEQDGQILPNPSRRDPGMTSRTMGENFGSYGTTEPILKPPTKTDEFDPSTVVGSGSAPSYDPTGGDPRKKIIDGKEYRYVPPTRPAIIDTTYGDAPEEQWVLNEPEGVPPAAPTPIENARANYEKALRTPAEKQSGWKQGLFMGLQGLEKVGDAMAGVKNDKEIQWLGNAKRNAEIQRTGGIYAPMEAQRQRDLEAQNNQLKARATAADASKKMIEAVQATNPLLGKQIEEALKGNGTVTPEMVQAAKAAGYGHVFEADNRDRSTIEVGGARYSTPTSGTPNYTATNAPVDSTKIPLQRTMRDGTPFFTTGNEAADREAMEAYRQANLDMEAGKFNIQQMQDYEERLTKWGAEEAERNNQLNGYVEESVTKFNEGKQEEINADKFATEAANLRNNPRFDRDTDIQKQYNDLNEKAAKAKAKSVELLSKSNELGQKAKNSKSKPMPTRPTEKLESPNISQGGTISKSQLSELAKATGKTPKELLEWAKLRNKKVID